MLVGYLCQLCWTYEQIELTNALSEQDSFICRGLTVLKFSLKSHSASNQFLDMTPKAQEILPSATMWMDLEDIMLSKIGQTQKDKYHMISLTGAV